MLVLAIILLGAFMLIFPKLCLKKSEREVEYAIKDMRKRGLILVIVGVVVEVILLIVPYITGTM